MTNLRGVPQVQRYWIVLPALLLLITATPALADMPMFPVIAFARFSVWWTIPLALLIEAAAIRWIFDFSWVRSALASLSVNVATMLLGMLIYPTLGMVLYTMLAPAVIRLLGTQSTVELSATLLVTSFIDTGLELVLLVLLFKAGMLLKRAFLFLVANILSAGILFGALVLGASPERIPDNEITKLEHYYAAEIEFMTELLNELPNRRTPSRYSFESEWKEAKWAEADALRFRGLWIRAPRASANLQPPAFRKSREFEARRIKDGVEVNRGWDDGKVPIYSYKIRRSVEKTNYEVYAIFEAPNVPRR